MTSNAEEKRVYSKPEMKRVQLSLAEVALGTACWVAGAGDAALAGCYQGEPALCRNPGV